MLEIFEIVGKAVADPNRVRILKLLESGELCVCQITTVLGLSAATVSKHLSLLKTAGLVFQRKEGRWVYYRLADRPMNPHALPMLALVRAQLSNEDPRLAEDQRLLALVDALPLSLLCDQGRAALPPADRLPSCC